MAGLISLIIIKHKHKCKHDTVASKHVQLLFFNLKFKNKTNHRRGKNTENPKGLHFIVPSNNN